MRPHSAALTPYDEALIRLRAVAPPVAPCKLPLAASIGSIAATDLTAARDIPPNPVALRDGFAVAAASIGGASPYGPVMLPRDPDRIEAGEVLPAGTDAILPPEGWEGRYAVAEVGTGDAVRATGEDVRIGDPILREGERIGSLHLLALAANGFHEVAIRRPAVRVVVTGAPEPDALSPMLAGLIARAGGLVEIRPTPDDPEVIAEAIRAGGADAVFVLGGTGFGRTDRSAEGLARTGRVLAHGLALRPGETAGIGESDERPVLLLPGRPDAGLAIFLALGLPLIAHLSAAPPPRLERASLTRKVTSAIGLTEIVFVRRRDGAAEPLGSVDLPLRRLIAADGAVLVPPEREGYPGGTEVEVVPL